MSAAMYRRGKWWAVRVPLPEGGSVPKTTRSRERDTAKAMERMLAELYDRPLYHPILQAIRPRKGLSLTTVYTHWKANTLASLLASLRDVDLSQYVEQWQAKLEADYGKYEWVETATGTKRQGETTRQYVRQVRALIAYAGGSLPRSRFTAALVSPWLAGLGVKSPTRRRYYAAVNQFAEYLVTIAVLERNPLADLSAPPAGKPRDRHLTKAEWLKLIEASHEPYRTAEVLAHLGIEEGVIPTIRRKDVDLVRRTVHARGTKREWRNRLCYIYEWALPYLSAAIKGKTPDALLVPRSTDAIRVAHNETCGVLGIEDYHVHDARHSVAVWLISAGTPAEVVRQQLGHKDTRMVDTVYGVYRATSADAERWSKVAEARDVEEAQS
jgi:integrase